MTFPLKYDPAFLTGRQIEVLGLASQGLNNLAISVRLGVSQKSVQTYFTEVYQKLHLQVDGEITPRVMAVLMWQKAFRDGEASFLRPGGTIFKQTPYWE